MHIFEILHRKALIFADIWGQEDIWGREDHVDGVR